MSEQQLPWISAKSLHFPDVKNAWSEPNGLLAVGGDLSSERLVHAYCKGIFPWYNENEPILWWSPDPRCVLRPENVRVTRSLKKTLNKELFEIRFDQNFEAVIDACAAPRKALAPGETGTWISDEMKQAYMKLFDLGYAHCVEAWLEEKLVGGLYGLAIGKVFFGESMFSRATDASKVAFVHLCRKLQQLHFKLIDGQVYSAHLETLGFELIPRDQFVSLLDNFAVPGQMTKLSDENYN